MADIRINALATTAASTASDDFVAVDGSANGTRKLNAYSPTFGGNVVATGTLTVNSTTDSSSKDTGAIVTEGGLGVEKSASIGGNLTVSGTGASSFAGRLSISSTTGVGLQTALAVSSSSGLGVFTDYTKTSGTSRTWSLGATGSSSSAGDNAFALYDGTAAAFRFLVTSNGNFLLGKTIESTNGKLQLADHTTSAGGIGFGTDVSLYRPQAGVLAIDGSQAALYLRDSGTTKGRFNVTGSTLYIDGVDASGSTGQIILRTGNGGGTALTLDSSQNATFTGNVTAQKSSGSDVVLALNQIGIGQWTFKNEATTGNFKLSIGGNDWVTVNRTTGATTLPGSIAIGNTVNTVSPTSPNRTITMVIGGTTYYIHAKTTND